MELQGATSPQVGAFGMIGGGPTDTSKSVGPGQTGQIFISQPQQQVNLGGTNMQASVASNTLNILYKLGSDILAPHIEAEKTRLGLIGMQKAMAGEAMAEVIDEQPWYSKIFGDSDLINGARAYTAQSQINKFGAAVQSQMKDMRGMNPEQFAPALQNMLANHLTGDEGTDKVISQMFVEQAGTLMKVQAKEHYKWGQEQINAKQQGAWQSAGDGLALAAQNRNNGMLSDNDWAMAIDRFNASFQPAAG